MLKSNLDKSDFHGSSLPAETLAQAGALSGHGALVKKSLRRLGFVRNLSIPKVNLPMDNPV